MNRLLLVLLAFLALPAFGADRVIINPDLDGDIKIKVNDGGVIKDAISITGSTGATALLGTSTNDSAAAGYVGEYLESTSGANVSQASPVLGTAYPVTDVVVSPTAGDWEICFAATMNMQWSSGASTAAHCSSLIQSCSVIGCSSGTYANVLTHSMGTVGDDSSNLFAPRAMVVSGHSCIRRTLSAQTSFRLAMMCNSVSGTPVMTAVQTRGDIAGTTFYARRLR